MKLFTCIDHDGHWPVGVASIIVARNETEAKKLLDEVLHEDGLETFEKKPYTLQEIDLNKPKAVLLHSGEY